MLRGWTTYFRHAAAKTTFSYLQEYTWRRVIGWMRRKYRRSNWKESGAATYRGWWPRHGNTALFDPERCRSPATATAETAIPTPWSADTTTDAA